MGDWRNAKLTELAEYINGYAFKPSDFSEDGVPIIRIEQLKNSNGNYDFYDGKIPERNWINNGDLIFSWSASLFLKIWQHGFAYLNQHLFKVIAKEEVDKLFLKYLLEASIEELTKMSHGSTMQHITRKELQKFEVKLPSSFPEQSTIATILTTIDQAIEKTAQLIAKYERIKTGLMQDLLTRGIDKNGNIRSEETHEFKDSELGRIPVDWEVGTIGKDCKIQNSFRKPLSAEVREGMKGKYRYYGPTGILDYINEYRVEGKYVLIGEDGDHFLKYLSQEMTLLVNGEFNVNNHAHILEGKDHCTTEWIHCFFSHRDITPHLTRQGAGRFKLNKAALSALRVTLPEKDEQTRIINKINSLRKYLDNENNALKKMEELKKGLMQDLLSGKVNVDSLLK